MSAVEEKLKQMGLKLEAPKHAAGNYLGSKRIGNLLYVSARVSDLRGEVGTDVTEAEAKKAAADTVLLLLAIIKEDIKNLDLIVGVIKMQGFIRSASEFTAQPKVLDGASELLIILFGEKGRHARTAIGAKQLPAGATIQLDMILELAPEI
ncbi:MAG: RidA family protein [Bacteroidetes bacterium]|nr:RidA family protein [Bacteroidota bacterium]